MFGLEKLFGGGKPKDAQVSQSATGQPLVHATSTDPVEAGIQAKMMSDGFDQMRNTNQPVTQPTQVDTPVVPTEPAKDA